MGRSRGRSVDLLFDIIIIVFTHSCSKIPAPIWREFQEEGIVEEPEQESRVGGEGIKMYLQKGGKCYNLNKTEYMGNAYLSTSKINWSVW